MALVIGDDSLDKRRRRWGIELRDDALGSWECGANGLDKIAMQDLPLVVQGSAGAASFMTDNPEPIIITETLLGLARAKASAGLYIG